MNILHLLLLAGCVRPDPPPTEETATPGTVTGEDTGTHDSDSASTETGTDTDSGEIPWRDDLIAVVGEPGPEVRFIERQTGEMWAKQTMKDWFPESCDVGPCRLLGFQHEVVDDQDQMVFAYTFPQGEGMEHLGGMLAVALGVPGEVLWEFIELEWDTFLPDMYDGLCAGGSTDPQCRMSNPHTVIRMPDQRWLVADSARDRVLVLEPESYAGTQADTGLYDARRRGSVRAVIDKTTQPKSSWQECEGPNNVELWIEDGKTYALLTCRGDTGEGGGITRHGSLSLWNLSDLDHIQEVWHYPKGGFIKASHHGRVIDGPDGPWLVYGHSMGESGTADEDRGSVGVARFSVEDGPTYLGDGRLPPELGEFGFVRSVSPMPDGEGLFIADSGCEFISDPCDNPARLVEVTFPELEPSGLGGTWTAEHEDQAFFELDVTRILEGDQLGGYPYEAEFLPYDSLGEPLRTAGGVTPAK